MSEEPQAATTDDEYEPETAELRDGETTDDDAHARRNAEQIRIAEKSLRESDNTPDDYFKGVAIGDHVEITRSINDETGRFRVTGYETHTDADGIEYTRANLCGLENGSQITVRTDTGRAFNAPDGEPEGYLGLVDDVERLDDSNDDETTTITIAYTTFATDEKPDAFETARDLRGGFATPDDVVDYSNVYDARVNVELNVDDDADMIDVLEHVYRDVELDNFDQIDRTQYRSPMLGDVFVVDDTAYAVERIGFGELENVDAAVFATDDE